jgi:hypothetical protein
MLIELWERLHGYDRWTPAVATVQSTKLSPVGELGSDKSNRPPGLGLKSVCKIRWKDQNQNEHTAAFQAFEESPLYQLPEGDTVNIRFNPAKSQPGSEGLVDLLSFFLNLLNRVEPHVEEQIRLIKKHFSACLNR